MDARTSLREAGHTWHAIGAQAGISAVALETLYRRAAACERQPLPWREAASLAAAGLTRRTIARRLNTTRGNVAFMLAPAAPAAPAPPPTTRPPLPPGHPRTWGLLTNGTPLDGSPYTPPAPILGRPTHATEHRL